MNKEIKVRFAPSPTGRLHLGGARTAIYNWIFARSNQGEFLLRIEDTDVKRSKKEFTAQIIDALKWLGLDWDGASIKQSERMGIYEGYAHQLLQADKAYRCFCDDTESNNQKAKQMGDVYKYSGKCRSLSKGKIAQYLHEKRPYALRFKMDSGQTSWKDVIYEDISVDNSEMDDFVILKSDGSPTYQLAVVVDDSEMNISHVIRGGDHISNTPKQIKLYQALGKPIPKFAHLPLLIGEDGQRLSKRHAAIGINVYRERGYAAAAVFNYLALLGWAPKDNREVLTRKQILNRFSLKSITKKPAVFDEKKLAWLSGKHISMQASDVIYQQLLPILIKHNLVKPEKQDTRRVYIEKVIDLMKSRMQTYYQFAERGYYFFREPERYDPPAVKKYWDSCTVNRKMEWLLNSLQELDNWSTTEIERSLRDLAQQRRLKAAELIHPLRLAITGFGVSPGIFQVASLLGKECVIERIKKALNSLPLKGISHA